MTSNSRTARCGPACRVVWQGCSQVTAPYADVRPAWAHSYGCKSRHKRVTASEVKRNCMRATEWGEEARNINREPMNKKCIEGAAKQGEWAQNHEALVTKAKWRTCAGCAMKECDSYLGRSRLTPERATALPQARSQQRP